MDEVMTVTDAVSSGSMSQSSSYSSSSMLPSNLPLLSALLACALAQFLKLFTNWYVKFNQVIFLVFINQILWRILIPIEIPNFLLLSF